MAAVAQLGAQQQAAKGPEIVVVNDGGPVESVETQSKAIGIAKIVGIVLVPLIVGIVVGQISQSAKTVNRTIDDAAVIAEVVDQLRRPLNEKVFNELVLSRQRGPGGKQFLANDKDLTDKLAADNVLPPFDDPKTEDDLKDVVYRSYMYNLDPLLVSDMLAFFSGYEALRQDIADHVRVARRDEGLMTRGKAQREDVKVTEEKNAYWFNNDEPYALAILVGAAPDNARLARAQLVEVGSPVCADEKAEITDGSCPGDQIQGFKSRASTVGEETWKTRGMAQAQGETAPFDQLIPLTPTGVLEEIIKGGEPSAAEAAYLRRVITLYQRAELLLGLGLSIQDKLAAKGKEGKSFTFFL